MSEQPVFIEANLQTIVDEMVADYESRTGKTLEPSHPERLQIDTFAYREYLLRVQIQNACLQNLVEFANAPLLDYLGGLVNVYRLQKSSAVTIIRFNGTGAPIFVPKGTRVSDGTHVFETIADLTIGTGVLFEQRSATAVIEGSQANDIAIGEIDTLVDSITDITSVENVSVTSLGNDGETDEQLRARIKEGPAQYSTAGPTDAYKFFTKTINPSVIDVAVSASAGTITVYPLMFDSEPTPTAVLSEIQSGLNDETIRPLTDTVVATSPTKLTRVATITLTLYNDGDANQVNTLAAAAMDELVKTRKENLGLDILEDHITGACMVEGVYKVDLTGWTDTVVAFNEFVVLTYSVSISSTTNG